LSINIKRLDAVIFDLDGTLVDSLPDMLVALNRLLKAEGRRHLEIKEVFPLIGGGAPRMIQSAYELTGYKINDDDLDLAVAKYILYYKEFPAEHSKIYDGVVDVLDDLYSLGIKMGICSNKAYEMVCLILSAFDLDKYFCAVTGGDNVTFNKPDGRHIEETLKLMGVSSKKILMVGDTKNDIEAARDAGLPVIAVNYGYSSPDELLSATIVIDDFRKLAGLNRI
jgi:phosphoglycolate phosphatase